MRTAAEQREVDAKRAERAQSRLRSGLFQSLPCHLLPRRFKNYGPMIREFRRDLVEAVKAKHGPEIGFVLAEAIQRCVIHHQRHVLSWAMIKKEGGKLSPAEIERYLTVGERALGHRYKVMVELGLKSVDEEDDGFAPWRLQVEDPVYSEKPVEAIGDELGADDDFEAEDAPSDAVGPLEVIPAASHAGRPGSSSSKTAAAAGASSPGNVETEDPIW